MSKSGKSPRLDSYLSAALERYEACLGATAVGTHIPDLLASVRFHYLKLDGNGRPQWRELARNLASHILSYCFSVQRRKSATTDVELMDLSREAREFFRKSDRSGEAGEMLLFFLLEAVLGAPQMVSKIALKTSPEVETYGSDGVHMKWNSVDKLMDIYFGEAKLHQSLASGTRSAVESIEKFHQNSMEEFEMRLVTRHYKHADDATKDHILKYVNRGTSSETARVNHACLLGYDWDAYDKLKNANLPKMAEEFESLYLAEQPSIAELIQGHFSNLTVKRLRFEVFVLPFTSVDEFRKAFLEAL